MAARVISGVQIAREVRGQLKSETASLKKKGITPGLAIVVLKSPTDRIHVARLKERTCRQLGINCQTYYLPEKATEDDLSHLLIQLNMAPEIHGINIHPLPSSQPYTHFSIDAPSKDIEGFHF